MSAISINIRQKYDTQFYFYSSKSINELIYVIGNPQSIQFEDIKNLYDDLQYLRRAYRMKTLDGRAEIDQRIQVVSKYYHENHMLTWEHPLMFVTNTKELFLKRQKRLKQLKQNDLQQKAQINPSSQNQNQTSHPSSSLRLGESSQSQPKSTFLNDLSLSFDILMSEDYEDYLDINDELDSSIHDVFEDQQDFDRKEKIIVKNQSLSVSKQLFTFEEHKLSHLVCDFEEVDIDQAITFYKEIVKSKNGSAIMSEILEEEHIKLSGKSSQNSKSKENIRLKTTFHLSKPPLPKHPKESVLQSYISIFGSKLSKNKQKLKLYGKTDIQKEQQQIKNKLMVSKYLDQVKNIGVRNIQNEQQQDQRNSLINTQNSKTKIRQKAEKLLEKIKRQSFSVELR